MTIIIKSHLEGKTLCIQRLSHVCSHDSFITHTVAPQSLNYTMYHVHSWKAGFVQKCCSGSNVGRYSGINTGLRLYSDIPESWIVIVSMKYVYCVSCNSIACTSYRSCI